MRRKCWPRRGMQMIKTMLKMTLQTWDETICVLFKNTTAKFLAEIAENVRYPLSDYVGIWNSHVGSLPLRIYDLWHSIVRMAGKAVCRHHAKIHVWYVLFGSTSEQKALYLVHQLERKTNPSNHTTHHYLIDVLHWCLLISQRTHKISQEKK